RTSRHPAHGDPEPAPLLETPGAGSLPCPGRRAHRPDRSDRRGRAGEERRGASRRDEDPGAGSGDPARDSGSLAGALHPRRNAEDPEGALGSLRLVRGCLSGSGGQAEEGGPERGLSAGQLPAPPAVRSSLSPFPGADSTDDLERTGKPYRSDGRSVPCGTAAAVSLVDRATRASLGSGKTPLQESGKPAERRLGAATRRRAHQTF